MTTFISSRFVRVPVLFLGTLFLTAFPYYSHAEAFKGGFMTSGQEKTVFFVLLLIVIAIVVGIGKAMRASYKKSAREEGQVSTVSLIILIFLGVLLMTFLGSL